MYADGRGLALRPDVKSVQDDRLGCRLREQLEDWAGIGPPRPSIIA
jgi:hypothetical protein